MTLSIGVPARNGRKDVSLADRYVVSRVSGAFFVDATMIQTLYHRRKRDSNCVIGKQEKESAKVVQNCACTDADFEWYVLSLHPIYLSR